MNKNNTIAQVALKTGMNEEICEKVIKAFEKQAEQNLENRFKGNTIKADQNILEISEKSGCTVEECEKILVALEETLDGGLKSKFKFFKK